MSVQKIEARQCRAARSLLGWKQSELALSAGVTLPTISDFETEKRAPHPNNLAAIKQALESAGVEFLHATTKRGAGVRLRAP